MPRSNESARSVRETFRGFTTSRVPGSAAMRRSSRAAIVRSESRFSPPTRNSIGALIGGPFSNSFTSIRASGYASNCARNESSMRGVVVASYSSSSAKISPYVARSRCELML